MEKLEEASFAETPTWAVATVVTVLVSVGFLIHGSLKKFGKVKEKTIFYYSILELCKIFLGGGLHVELYAFVYFLVNSLNLYFVPKVVAQDEEETSLCCARENQRR